MSKVQPNVDKKLSRKTTHNTIIYYSVAFSLQFINFIPGLIKTKSFTHNSKIPSSVLFLFAISCVLSIPPLFESCVDTFVTIIYEVHHPNIVEHNFGHNLLLISLLLPIVLVIGEFAEDNSQYNLLFASCFIDCCLGITVSAIYGKLQVFGDSRWNMSKVMPILIFFTGGQTMLNQGLSTCTDDISCQLPHKMVITSLVLSVVCLVLHLFHSRTCLLEVYHVLFSESAFFNTDNTTSVILVLILLGYFVVRIAVQANFQHNTTSAILARTGMHILLACLASILPARMVRSMLVTMKHEMDTKKTFIRYISHEIRSPLSTASLGLDYLVAQMSDNRLSYDQVLEVVRDAKTATEIATCTLNDLLMFDKIETGMLEVALTECDMWEFVNKCVKPFNIQASSDHITLKCALISGDQDDLESNGGSREIFANIDKYKMEQVVRNFLTNALKFTPKGGNITVNVSTRETFSNKHHNPSTDKKQSVGHRAVGLIDKGAGVVRVEVVDSGPGISAENLPKLFGQYVQFDANTLQGGKGSGLGLWLSKAIVEMHGGVIGATSDGPDLGCTFFLELPMSSLDDNSLDSAKSINRAPSDGATTITSSAIQSDVNKRSEPLLDNLTDRLSLQTPSVVGQYNAHEDDRNTPTRNSVELHTVINGKATQYQQLTRSPNSKLHHRKAVTPKTDSLRNIKVLLVDDSALSRKMVERSLVGELEGCVIHHAQNGLQAVQLVAQSLTSKDEVPYDVILMDYYMPVMSGPEAVNLIRTQGYLGVILAVTGVTSDSEFTTLLGKGVDRILVKPFSMEAFKQVMCGESLDDEE